MSITITPDPGFPLGGYAIATFQGGPVSQGAVTLKVSRLEDGYYLGASSWTSNPVDLGPFEVVGQDNGVALRLGPEVVDFIEPFQRLRIEAPALGMSSELSWPETVRKSASGSRSGSIHRRRTRKAAPGSTVPAATPQPEASPPETPQPDASPAETPKPEPADVEGTARTPTKKGDGQTPQRNLRWVALLLVGLVAAAGAGAWFYVNGMEEDSGPDQIVEQEGSGSELQPTPEPTPEPASATLTDSSCSMEEIGQFEAAQLYERAQACGAEDIGVEEQMISRAALQDYGPALLQQAKWFDPVFAEEESPYETRSAVSATRLYKKALDAGEESARSLLEAVCETLRASNDPVIQHTVKSNCQ